MNLQITPSQTKALLIGMVFIVILVALVYSLFLEPAISLYRNNDETIVGLSDRLGRYQQVAAGMEVLKKELNELNRNKSASDYYLKSHVLTLASAELQTYVKSVIDEVNGRLVSTQPFTENDRAASRLVKIQVRMTGDIETVQKVFYRLEFGKPGLLLNEVSIVKSRAGRQRRPLAAQQMDALDVRFNVTGFMRGAAS
jgi:hypothetical protein